MVDFTRHLGLLFRVVLENSLLDKLFVFWLEPHTITEKIEIDKIRIQNHHCIKQYSCLAYRILSCKTSVTLFIV